MKNQGRPQDSGAGVFATVPQARISEPGEVPDAALALATIEVAIIPGAEFTVDGARTA